MIRLREKPSRKFVLTKEYVKQFRTKDYMVDTEFYFWRWCNNLYYILELFCVRFYVTLVNWSVTTYRYLVYGPFGLCALCSISRFPSEWYKDGGCGAYHGSVVSAFRDVLKGMKNSR